MNSQRCSSSSSPAGSPSDSLFESVRLSGSDPGSGSATHGTQVMVAAPPPAEPLGRGRYSADGVPMPSSSTGTLGTNELSDAAPVSPPRVGAVGELRAAVELNRAAPADDARVEALRETLRTLDLHAAAKTASSWLVEHSLQAPSSSSSSNDSLQANVVSPPQLAAPAVEPPNAARLATPLGTYRGIDRGPVKMYDAEPVSMQEYGRMESELLTKPHPVFHGERDEHQREMAPVYEFPVHVRLLTRTHSLEAALRFTAPRVSARAGHLRPPHVGPRG